MTDKVTVTDLDPAHDGEAVRDTGLFEERGPQVRARTTRRADEAGAAAADPLAPLMDALQPALSDTHTAYTGLMGEQAAALVAAQSAFGAAVAAATDETTGEIDPLAPQDELGGRDDAAAALQAMQAQVQAAIEQLQRQMGALGDQMPGIADQIAALEGVQSDIQSLLTQVQNGMATPQMALSAINGLQTSLSRAIEGAQSEASISLGEFKADYYEAQFIARKRHEQMRSLIAESDFYADIEDHLSETLPGAPEAFAQDLALSNYHALTQSPEAAAAHLYNEALTAEEDAAIEEEKRRQEAHIQEMLDTATDPQRRERIQALLDAWDGYHSQEAYQAMVAIHEGEDPENEQTLLEEGRQQTAEFREIAVMSLQPPQMALLIQQAAQDAGVSVAEYMQTNPVTDEERESLANLPENYDFSELTSDQQLLVARLAASESYNLLRVSQQRMEIGVHLGIQGELAQELGAILERGDTQELNRRLHEDPDFAALKEFLELSASAQVDFMIEQGTLTEAERDTATFIGRLSAAMLADVPEDERLAAQVEHGAALHRLLNEMPRHISEDGVTESDADYHTRILGLMQQFEKNPALNPSGIDFPPDPTFLQGMAEASSRMTDEEFQRHFEQELTARAPSGASAETSYQWQIATAEALTSYYYPQGGSHPTPDREMEIAQQRATYYHKSLVFNGVPADDALAITREQLDMPDFDLPQAPQPAVEGEKQPQRQAGVSIQDGSGQFVAYSPNAPQPPAPANDPGLSAEALAAIEALKSSGAGGVEGGEDTTLSAQQEAGAKPVAAATPTQRDLAQRH